MARELTAKQRAFVDEYLSNGRNGAAAYRVAYFSSANGNSCAVEAQRLLRNPKIAPLVALAAQMVAQRTQRTLEQLALTRDEVIARLAALASYEADEIFEWTAKGVTLKPMHQISARGMYAIQGISEGADGRISVKLPDKRQALMDVAKLSGWVVDAKVELGPDGKPIAKAATGTTIVLQVVR
jgi:phage terminase small subunit